MRLSLDYKVTGQVTQIIYETQIVNHKFIIIQVIKASNLIVPFKDDIHVVPDYNQQLQLWHQTIKKHT